MLYLEDYLEMIEHLPQELRDRFTEMREMDLQVQNATDSLEDRVGSFFSSARKMKSPEKEVEYEGIRKDYYKALEDADEKVQLANQMYDLVDKYSRRLDQELHKFKMELEADNRGITEVLEKRSFELDQPPQCSSQKENRYSLSYLKEKRQSHNSTTEKVVPERSISERQTSTYSVPLPNVGYSLEHMGAGGNAIAAAASQAIAATQQMQQGRRTASLKASYEAVNLGVYTQEFSIGRELAGAAQTAIAATQESVRKQKKLAAAVVTDSSSSPTSPTTLPSASPIRVTPSQVNEDITVDGVADTAMDNPDWTYDPNEPRYCLCNQVSYGEMVACDNEDCPFEWFHYPCVGITASPKGKWYCPQCSASMKRRGSRK